MAVKTKPENVSELEWNVDNEVQLFLAMTGHKPVGVNKYFHMLCIKEKFVSSVHKEVRREAIWNHLNTLYDMQALDDFEHLPFPNPEKEFSLPDSEFASLMKQKLDNSLFCKEITSEPESETELKREVTRELQVYKGMKDIKKESREEISKETIQEQTMETQNIDPVAGSNLTQLGSPVLPLKKTASQDKKSGKEKESKKDMKSSSLSKSSASSGSKPSTPVSKSASPSKLTSTPVSKPSTYSSRSSLEKDSKLATKSRTSSLKKDLLVKENKSDLKKDRVKELSSVEEPPKRSSSKRSWPTRGSVTDSASTKSASPITTPTPPPSKRRRI